MESVILVNEHDEEVGTMEKLRAHKEGKLHRAFSVLIFNSKGELLLQKRAASKYHSGGLWSNTCCSHPQPGETILEAANRKLLQEMGIEADLTSAHKFIYKAKLDNQLTEYECDHVIVGYFDGEPILNRHEAEDYKFLPVSAIQQDALANPDQYTCWFKLILNQPEMETLPVLA